MSASPSGPQSPLPIAVVGGGAAGLAAAFQLVKAGRAVRLFEAGIRLGGSVATVREDGWLIEAGPNTLQENAREIAELIRELGLDGERVVANPAAKNRYIVREGRPCAVPNSPAALFRTPLFSFGTKLRLLREPFLRPRRRTGDVSFADFTRDHFGQEIVDYAVNPFVSGIYAGDARKLSTRHAFPKLWESEQTKGSLIRGLLAQAKARRAAGHPKTRLISFRNGLQSIIDALAGRLPAGSVELGVKVETLFPGAPWRVVWSRDGQVHTEEFSQVLLAIPATALAHMAFGSLGERPFATLETIDSPPVSSLFLGFRRDQVVHPLDGFGALVPAVERLPFLGVLFSSSLFPGRAPEGHVALTVMAGGLLNPDLARLGQAELVQTVLPALDHLLGVKGHPVFQKHHFWPRAIPQYQLGYERHLDAMSEAERNFPGLLVGGSVRDGIAFPSAMLSGVKLAGRALNSP